MGWYLLPLALLLQLSSTRILAQDRNLDDYAPDKVLSFANWLYFVDHDYGRAGDEYYRYLFLNNTPNDSIQFRIAFCRKKEGKLEVADELFKKLGNSKAGSAWRCKAIFHSAQIAFLMGNYGESDRIIEREADSSYGAESTRVNELRVLDFLGEEEWDKANNILNSNRNIILADAEQRFALLLNEAQTLQRKNPWIAGGLSAIIPGAGKVYTSEWQDGLYSFLYVAFTGYLSYTGFHAEGTSSVKGWIFGSLSATLYAGNIYGSVQSANAFNARFKLELFDKIKHLGEDLGKEE